MICPQWAINSNLLLGTLLSVSNHLLITAHLRAWYRSLEDADSTDPWAAASKFLDYGPSFATPSSCAKLRSFADHRMATFAAICWIRDVME